MKSGDRNAIIVLNYVIPSLMSVVFLGFFIVRIIKLQKVATHTKFKLNWSLSFRITLLCIDLVIEITNIFLSGFLPSYYTYRRFVVLMVVFTILTIGLQILLMMYEFNKNVPLYYMHKIYWLSITVSVFIGVSVSFATDGQEAQNYILELLRLTDLLLLCIYTFFIRKQDIYDFENQPFFSNQLPELFDSYIVDQYRQKSMTNYGSTADGPNSSFLQVVLENGWSLVQVQGEVKVEVKFGVFLPQTRMYKVKRTIDEFIHLWARLESENKEYFDVQQIEYQEYKSLVLQLEQSQTTQQTLLVLKKLIYKLTSRIEVATESLLEFFTVPQTEAQDIQNRRLWKLGFGESQQRSMSTTRSVANEQVNRFRHHSRITEATTGPQAMIEFKTSTVMEIAPMKSSKRSNTIVVPKESVNDFMKPQKQHKALDIESEFLQYFDVKVKSTSQQGKPGNTFTVYHVAISLMLPQQPGRKDVPNNWVIQKRYTDFFELDQTLKVFLGIKHLPPLPKKKLTNLDGTQTAERQHGLEQYLRSLLNDKLYHHYSLFKFIELSKDLEEEVKMYQTVLSTNTENFEDFIVLNQGHELVIDEKKGYVRYQFKMIRKNNELISTFTKRFSDFSKLNYALRSRFHHEAQLPELPPKFTSFGQKTTALVREKQLCQYLNQLLRVTNIQESVHLRQFLAYKVNQQPQRKTSNGSRKVSNGTKMIAASDQVIEDFEAVFKSLDRLNEEDETKLDELYIKQRD